MTIRCIYQRILLDVHYLEKEFCALFLEDTFTAKDYPDISLSPLIGWKKVKRTARLIKTG
jgi:hypothetical protein